MKNLIFAFLLLFINYNAIAQANQKAIDYNDKIVEEQDKIGEKIISFNAVVGDNTSAKTQAEASLKEILSTVDAAISATEKLGAFDGNNELQTSALNLFKFYKKCMSSDYSAMINIVYKESPTEADYAELEKVLKKVTDEEKVVDADFQKAQENFSKKYNFTLTENKLQEEIDK